MSRTWSIVLFVAGLLCTAVIGGAQFVRLLNGQSATIVWYLSFASFLALNIGLSIPPYRAKRNWITAQPLISYCCYMVMILSNIAVIIAGGRSAIRWTVSDQLTVIICVVGIALTVAISRFHHKLSANDPVVRGIYALFFKAIPQLLLAWNIAWAGTGELSGLALTMGHSTIVIRFFQIRGSLAEMRADPEGGAKRRYITGSLISEIGNELSWLVVTAVWCYRESHVAGLAITALAIFSALAYAVYMACDRRTRR